MMNTQQGRFGGLASLVIAVTLAVQFASAQTIPDLNHDGAVNFTDYSLFARSWRQQASWLDPNDTLDFNDLTVLSGRWLEGSIPVTYVQWLGHSSVKGW